MSFAKTTLFIVVFAAILFGGHWYVWARLVRDPALSPPLRQIGTGLAWAMGALMFGSLVLARALPRSVFSPLAWVGYAWMGVLFFVIALFGTADLARGVAWMVRR